MNCRESQRKCEAKCMPRLIRRLIPKPKKKQNRLSSKQRISGKVIQAMKELKVLDPGFKTIDFTNISRKRLIGYHGTFCDKIRRLKNPKIYPRFGV